MNSEKRKIILSIAGVLALLGGIYFLYQHLTYVSTDDANIQAHTLMVSARVGGNVQEVLVDENQNVKAGQVLARIDDRDNTTALQQAKADVASLEARVSDAQKNYERIRGLFQGRAVSRAQFDDAQAQYREASERLKATKAQLDQRALNLSYTNILAPMDGKIAKRSVEPGMFVAPGQPLFGFVEGKQRWVVANFKETDLPQIQPGRKATVDVDAVPGRSFEGEVESVSSGTGATFALLPPDNATGNFTKVVQRVPVRIKLSQLKPEDVERLQAGLSAFVSVRIR